MGQSGSAAGGEVKEHTYKSGNVYVGTWKRGKRQGRGKYTWTDGTVYEGNWVNNEQHGMGVMHFVNGNSYEGMFKHNNIDGTGTLRTKQGEILSGTFEFVGRSIMTPQAYSAPVSMYRLDVAITDSETGRSQRYKGDATIHLLTGLVVLPNMQQPEEAILPYAVAVVADDGREVFSAAMQSNQPVASAVPAVQTMDAGNQPVQAIASAPSFELPAQPTQAVATPLQNYPAQAAAPPPAIGYPQAVATPVVAMPMTSMAGGVSQAELEQRLINEEEQAEMGVGSSSGVAYGVQDPALRPVPHRRPIGKMEVFNPKNYF